MCAKGYEAGVRLEGLCILLDVCRLAATSAVFVRGIGRASPAEALGRLCCGAETCRDSGVSEAICYFHKIMHSADIYAKRVVNQHKMYNLPVMSKIFGIWRRISDLQADLGGEYNKCRAWKLRGEIPRAYDAKLIQVLPSLGFETTWEKLDAWHEAHKQRRRSLRKSGHPVDNQDVTPFPALPFSRLKASVVHSGVEGDE